jgi:hypothetical protein
MVDTILQDSITVVQQPSGSGIPGVVSSTPFIINVVSSTINRPIIVQLYAVNSNSIPLKLAPTKWSFLTPTWSFTDKNNNVIDTVTINTVPVYKNNQQVGVSGTGVFYYTDSLPTDNLNITLTLETSAFFDPIETDIYNYPSYSNSTITTTITSWQIQNYEPNTLRVTGNYIDSITPYKWINVPIPVMLTLHNNNSDILFNYPETNSIGTSNGLTLSAYDDNGNVVPCIFDTTQRFQQTANNGTIAGGYLFTTVTPLATGTNVTIVASTTQSTNTITGSSTPFNIIDFVKTYNVFKINENFNMASYMQSLALPDILSQNIEFFNQFLGGVAGNAQLSATPDIGRTIYEKIANFTTNTTDVDTCEISQLLSLSNMVDVSAAEFSTFYPADIQKALNLASIPASKLFGNIDLQYIEPDTTDLTRRHPLNTATDSVTAGSMLALQSIYQSNLEYVTVPLGPNNAEIYPLSAFNYPGLITPILQHYKFFKFMPVYAGGYSTIITDTNGNTLSAFNDLAMGQAELIYNTIKAEPWFNPYIYNISIQHTVPSFVNNVIDWNNPLTTLSPYLSTAEDLYKDGGAIEAMFNYALTKNLFFNVG